MSMAMKFYGKSHLMQFLAKPGEIVLQTGLSSAQHNAAQHDAAAFQKGENLCV